MNVPVSPFFPGGPAAPVSPFAPGGPVVVVVVVVVVPNKKYERRIKTFVASVGRTLLIVNGGNHLRTWWSWWTCFTATHFNTNLIDVTNLTRGKET